MNLRHHTKRSHRDLHYLNKHGMVACNPRDREAAHRADVEGIATEDMDAVTCKKCWRIIRREKIEDDLETRLRMAKCSFQWFLLHTQTHDERLDEKMYLV